MPRTAIRACRRTITGRRGCQDIAAALCAGVRRLRLLSVTGSRRPPSSAGRVHGCRLTMWAWPRSRAVPAALEPCPRQKRASDWSAAGVVRRSQCPPAVVDAGSRHGWLRGREVPRSSALRIAATLTDSVIPPFMTDRTASAKGIHRSSMRSSPCGTDAPLFRLRAKNMCATSVVTPLLLSIVPRVIQLSAVRPVSSTSSRFAASSGVSPLAEPPVGIPRDNFLCT